MGRLHTVAATTQTMAPTWRCFGRNLLVATFLGCLLFQVSLTRRAILWGDALHPTLDYDSPLMRVEWHHPSDDASITRRRQRRDRVLMIQYFPTLNFSISSSDDDDDVDDDDPRQELQRYTRQVNKEYAERWGYEFLQIMGVVNQTQSLLEVFDALKHENESYDQLLLLPHEGILLNDFMVDVTTAILMEGTPLWWQQRQASTTSIVYYQSPLSSYCHENDDGNKAPEEIPSYFDLLWNEGMTLWKLSRQHSGSFSTLLRSLLSTNNTTLSSAHGNNKNKVLLACFPGNFLGRVFCDSQQNNPPETPPLLSSWFNYSSSSSSHTSRRQQRLLIGQYSGHGIYGKLLNVTSQISRRYCRKWGCDVLVLQGKPWKVPPLDTLCPSPAHRASFTKITLLKMALSSLNHHPQQQQQQQQYDQLLLLDADAFVYDWNFDITDLLTKISSKDDDDDDDTQSQRQYPLPMLTAHKVKRKSQNYTWNVNNGVTLWNLRHPKTRLLAKHWDLNAMDKILEKSWIWRQRSSSSSSSSKNLMNKNNNAHVDEDDAPRRIGDQEILHKTIRQLNLSNDVYGSREVMEYENGTVIKHLIRIDSKQWGNVGDSECRYMSLKGYSRELCDRYPSDCVELL
jgi:hypothetical protein